MSEPVVWLPSYHRYAILEQRNAYFSIVYWYEGDERVEISILNDEYEIVGDDDNDDDE